MEEQLDPHEVAHTRLLTGVSRILALMYLGAKRKVDFIRAGLGASTLYHNLILLEEAGLIVKRGDEYLLTEKGARLAEAIYKLLVEAKSLLGDLLQQ